jgi:steroid delta-isomerase
MIDSPNVVFPGALGMTRAATPAQLASFASLYWVQKKNKVKWLDLFADDALLEDPVGVSLLDPTGRGHRGKQAIGRFWESIVTGSEFEYTIHRSFACGDECANHWQGGGRFPDGTAYETHIMGFYRVDGAGKLISIRAFYDRSILTER